MSDPNDSLKSAISVLVSSLIEVTSARTRSRSVSTSSVSVSFIRPMSDDRESFTWPMSVDSVALIWPISDENEPFTSAMSDVCASFTWLISDDRLSRSACIVFLTESMLDFTISIPSFISLISAFMASISVVMESLTRVMSAETDSLAYSLIEVRSEAIDSLMCAMSGIVDFIVAISVMTDDMPVFCASRASLMPAMSSDKDSLTAHTSSVLRSILPLIDSTAPLITFNSSS